MRDNIQVFAKYIEDLAEAKEKSNLQKKQEQGISREAQINYLTNLYSIDQIQKDNPIPIYKPEMFEGVSDAVINNSYYSAVNNPDFISTPIPQTDPVIGYPSLWLRTSYPIGHPNYRGGGNYIGHSSLQPSNGGMPVTGEFDDDDYNIVTNNCSNETGNCLQYIFGEDYNPFLFSTPGDVRDFAIELGGKQKDPYTITIPMNKEKWEKYKKYLYENYFPRKFGKEWTERYKNKMSNDSN